jgi:hypothetical protein
MLLVLFPALTACPTTARTSDFHLLELKELYVNYFRFYEGGQYPLITNNGLPNKEMDRQLDLHIKTDILHYFYWDSRIHSMTDRDMDTNKGQFRLVGLETRFGIRLSSTIEFGYYHFSQHTLDHQTPYHYPVQDALELKIYLYRNHERREPLL